MPLGADMEETAVDNNVVEFESVAVEDSLVESAESTAEELEMEEAGPTDDGEVEVTVVNLDNDGSDADVMDADEVGVDSLGSKEVESEELDKDNSELEAITGELNRLAMREEPETSTPDVLDVVDGRLGMEFGEDTADSLVRVVVVITDMVALVPNCTEVAISEQVVEMVIIGASGSAGLVMEVFVYFGPGLLFKMASVEADEACAVSEEPIGEAGTSLPGSALCW